MKQGRTMPAVAGGPARPRRRRRRMLRALAAAAPALVVLAALPWLAGCGNDASAQGGGAKELRVFAASSLTGAFTKLGDQYMAAHPGVKVTFAFAGSQDLAAQLQQGAPADVLATADTKSMAAVASLVEAPRAFAGNKLAIVVAKGDPQHITGLADLGRAGLKVVLAAPEVPAGAYAQQVLRQAHVHVEPVSLEDSVKGVVTKVSLGEADAGIVYATDVIAAGDTVAGVDIPASQNVLAHYPVARVRASGNSREAQQFIDLVLSADGRRVLGDAGFLPAAQ